MKENPNGNILKTKNGSTVRVLASRMPEAVAAEDISDGIVSFYLNPKIKCEQLASSYILSYTVTKQEFFTLLDKIAQMHPEKACDEKFLASELRKTYYKIPTLLIDMIVEAYLQRTE